jgi:hypothetical protein
MFRNLLMFGNLLIIFILLFLSSYSFAEDSNLLALEVDAPRPMAEAVIALSEQLHRAITYEDPPFEFAGDLRPVFTGSTMPVPNGGQISFSYQKTVNTLGIISQLLAQHYATGNAGEFIVVQTNDIYNVIPVRYRNKEAKLVEHHSILDTRISLALQDTNCQKALDDVCAAVSSANAQFQLVLGRTPINAFIQAPYSREIDDEPARDAINEILTFHNKQLKSNDAPILWTWQVRFSPPVSATEKPYYYLVFRRFLLQSPDSIKMRVFSERPMASAVQILEKRCGTVITYEDPPYICPSDLLGGPEAGGMGLRGGIIKMDWDKTHSLEKILELLVQTRIGPRDVPAVFATEKATENKYHIYPVVAKNEQGNLVSRTSLLNKQISFNAENIDGLTFVESFCSKLSEQINQDVALGPLPENLSEMLRKHRYPGISINSERARDCLGEYLWKIKRDISWQLLFDPSLTQYRLFLYNISD